MCAQKFLAPLLEKHAQAYKGMKMLKKFHALIAVLSIATGHNSALALNADCIEGKAPGKEYRGSQVDLPAPNSRKSLGVWKHVDFNGINVSLELANGTIYYVTRDRYCSSGKFGEKLTKKGSRFYRLENSADDYYEILSDGTLGRFDKQGLIDKFPVSNRLHPL